ncbi:AMP-binding protein [Rhizobiales bacterium]|uniref:phenylacetate--CoA ligase family protein n=1 Tax=Hongsoonwoonella zoysiae TaxID=2821844 RepID=UPI00155FF49A|nr:AMP-binding protein [Hongsoonwoonella zoysiae]NRG17293.1 AMP-binding protein [Hongsoonwoonella zoysiae]
MTGEHYDSLETRHRDEREADLFRRLPALIAHAIEEAPGWANHLSGVNPEMVTSRANLAKLPVLRKSELLEAQSRKPPFGDFAVADVTQYGRVFMSPGPIFEPQGSGADPWNGARALYAAGFRRGDIVHNCFAYHMTPGGFILDHGARALGCAVFPAGIGNTEMQLEAISKIRPNAYTGTPDYLKILLDKAAEAGVDVSSIRKGLVSGGALFPSLRAEYAERGVDVRQCYAVAEVGVIAYETQVDAGMVVNEDCIVEIVRPGTDEPVPDGEVGEVVVTGFSRVYPIIRLGTGDLSAIVSEPSPCGRTNMRLKGWMGRADQRTKIKGMFVDPKQVAEILSRHGEVDRARLIVERTGEQDTMRLVFESAVADDGLASALEVTLRDVTKLKGTVERADPGSLPNDGKVISDERKYD